MRTADEILDDELSDNMIDYLKENQIFREWIKDAMYNYADEHHKSEVLKLNIGDVSTCLKHNFLRVERGGEFEGNQCDCGEWENMC